MELIVMSSRDKYRSEIFILLKLFEHGLKTFHLKKPNFSKKKYNEYIKQIPKKYHKRIIIHHYFSLCFKYKLKGFHHNSKNPPSKYFKLFSAILLPNLYQTISAHSHQQFLTFSKGSYKYILTGPLYPRRKNRITNKFKNIDHFNNVHNKGKIIFYGGIEQYHINELMKFKPNGILIMRTIWYNDAQPLDIFLSIKKELTKKHPQ